MNINITSSATQQATAAQITALANHILHRKGQVDFTGTNVSVQCSDSLPADAAGIIVKCSGGKVKISGATEYTDEEWTNAVVNNGVYPWMYQAFVNYGIPYDNMFKALSIDNDIYKSFNGTNRWLVADGASYIDTGLPIAGTFIIDVLRCKFANVATGDNMILGSSKGFGIYLYQNKPYIYQGGMTSTQIQATVAASSPFDLYFKDSKYGFIQDGVETYADYTGSMPTDTSNLLIGKNNSVYMRSGNAIGMLRIYINGDWHFFIPMTKDSVNGMYDLIGQKFYTNANTSGAFTIE